MLVSPIESPQSYLENSLFFLHFVNMFWMNLFVTMCLHSCSHHHWSWMVNTELLRVDNSHLIEHLASPVIVRPCWLRDFGSCMLQRDIFPDCYLSLSSSCIPLGFLICGTRHEPYPDIFLCEYRVYVTRQERRGRMTFLKGLFSDALCAIWNFGFSSVWSLGV